MSATTVQKAPKPAPRPRTSGPAPQRTSADAPQRMNGDPPQLMTAEEYIALPERRNGITYELAQGRLVVRDRGALTIHSSAQGKLYRYLDEWIEKFGRGLVLTEGSCFLSENPDTCRIPDVAVLIQPFDSEKAFLGRVRGAPDIAIEVLSPSNDPKEILDKTAEYFKAGALRVWIVDPKAHTVVIRKADGKSALFEAKDILEDPEILPGFALKVQKIFDPPELKKFMYPPVTP